MSGVSCTWTTDCTAVGGKPDSGAYEQTLIESLAVPPTLTHVGPTSGPTAGGTAVSIAGSGFTGTTGVSGVTFGGTDAESYTVVSDTQISAVTPPGSPGRVTVVVNAPGGTASRANAFFYKAPKG